ncbi:MAG: GNAT family N-acetyltransferase [Spirochaetales bacterium]|nr:GNAT family N-acetyltransferase [Spirochaetales bacterium]
MIKYDVIQKKDIREAARMFAEVYTTICRNEGSTETMKGILDVFISPEKTDEEFFESIGKEIMFAAFDEEKIVGVILGIPGYINQLAVEPTHHKMGIAKTLMQMFADENIRRGIKEIEVKASLYAEKFYEKQGFVKSEGITDYKGLKCYPMRRSI